MADDTTIANVLASILHHVGTAGTTGLTGQATTTSAIDPLAGVNTQTAQEGQQALDAATQRDTTATPSTAVTGPTDTATIPEGSNAVGAPSGTAVAQEFGVNGHPGIDLSVPVGTPLVAAEDGTITVAGNNDPGGYGNYVEITAADGTVMRYGHLSGVNVAVGDTVKRGQLVGKSGGAAGAEGSGNSTGPHLHFEVDKNGQPVDPVPYLAGNSGGIVKGSATSNPAAKSVGDPTSTTISNILDVAAGKSPSHVDETAKPAQAATSGQASTGSTSDSDPGAVDAFLSATRQHESGGNYTIYNTSGQSNASGAYQFLNSTWQGAGGSTTAAAEASPAEQDRVARSMALQLFSQFHSWRLVAIAWYGGPGVAAQVAAGQNPGSPEGQGPYLAYGDTIVNMMQGGTGG